MALCAVLLAWNLWLTIRLEMVNSPSAPAVPQITQTTVSDYTTDLTDIIDNTRAAVVTVSSGSRTASGFVYSREDENLYLITTSDLYSDSGEVTVYFDSSAGMSAAIAGRDEATGIMLLRLQPGFEVRTSRIGDSDLLQQGEYVLALSGRSAETGSSAVSFGIVSEPGMMRLNASSSWLAGVIETDAVISPESAGGPLLDQGGAVVGMLLPRSLNGNDRLSFAVGINEIRLAAEELKEEGKVSRGSLGITVRSVADLRSYEKSTRGLQLDAVSGVLITAGGDSSELKPGDVLLSINGQTVADVSSLRTILYDVNSGEMAELQILRDGEETVLSTELQ